jgi:hypothetical protein
LDLAGRLGCPEKELVADDAHVGDREPEQDRGRLPPGRRRHQDLEDGWSHLNDAEVV